jgi:hypothetical protein
VVDDGQRALEGHSHAQSRDQRHEGHRGDARAEQPEQAQEGQQQVAIELVPDRPQRAVNQGDRIAVERLGDANLLQGQSVDSNQRPILRSKVVRNIAGGQWPDDEAANRRGD